MIYLLIIWVAIVVLFGAFCIGIGSIAAAIWYRYQTGQWWWQ